MISSPAAMSTERMASVEDVEIGVRVAVVHELAVIAIDRSHAIDFQVRIRLQRAK